MFAPNRVDAMTGAAATMELPARRYLPGRTERPAGNEFEHVKALCPPETNEGTAPSNVAWHYGLRLFNEAFFWEAHEVLEEVWQRARPNSRERFLVQCVIHLANAALKGVLDQPGASRRLVAMADETRQRAFAGETEQVMGLSNRDVARCCGSLASKGRPSRLESAI